MVLPAPEFVIAEFVELLDKRKVAAELQHWMLADRMMRGEEGSELQAGHGVFSGNFFLWDFRGPTYGLGGAKAIARNLHSRMVGVRGARHGGSRHGGGRTHGKALRVVDADLAHGIENRRAADEFGDRPVAQSSAPLSHADLAHRPLPRFASSTARLARIRRAMAPLAGEHCASAVLCGGKLRACGCVHSFCIALRAICPDKPQFCHGWVMRDAELTPSFNFLPAGSVRSFHFAAQQLSLADDVVLLIHPESLPRSCSGLTYRQYRFPPPPSEARRLRAARARARACRAQPTGRGDGLWRQSRRAEDVLLSAPGPAEARAAGRGAAWLRTACGRLRSWCRMVD